MIRLLHIPYVYSFHVRAAAFTVLPRLPLRIRFVRVRYTHTSHTRLHTSHLFGYSVPIFPYAHRSLFGCSFVVPSLRERFVLYHTFTLPLISRSLPPFYVYVCPVVTHTHLPHIPFYTFTTFRFRLIYVRRLRSGCSRSPVIVALIAAFSTLRSWVLRCWLFVWLLHTLPVVGCSFTTILPLTLHRTTAHLPIYHTDSHLHSRTHV